MRAAGWDGIGRALLLLGLWLGSAAVVPAADFPVFDEGVAAPAPRYFPRDEGEAAVTVPRPVRRRVAGCAPYRAAVPTDSPNDPSYVGSEYGLGKPSYYGFRPGLGYDDPYDRPLRYCP